MFPLARLLASPLQIGNDPFALVEWFVASIALVIAVTLVYVFLLSRAPPPEGLTEMKAEMIRESTGETPQDYSPILSEAQAALTAGDPTKAVELAVRAASVILSGLLKGLGVDPAYMNISDMAYIVQSKSVGASDITQPIYQLNLLHLRGEQSKQVTKQEAEWAINAVAWLANLQSTQQLGR